MKTNVLVKMLDMLFGRIESLPKKQYNGLVFIMGEGRNPVSCKRPNLKLVNDVNQEKTKRASGL